MIENLRLSAPGGFPFILRRSLHHVNQPRDIEQASTALGQLTSGVGDEMQQCFDRQRAVGSLPWPGKTSSHRPRTERTSNSVP